MPNRSIVATWVGCVLLVACHGSTGSATSSAATATASSASPPPVAESAPAPATATSMRVNPRPGTEGGMCGGIAAIQCGAGLKCVMVGPMHPDKAGTCQKP